MAHGVDARMLAEQATDVGQAVDLALAQARSEQLAAVHPPALSAGDLGDPRVARSRDDQFSAHAEHAHRACRFLPAP
jgi:hypothetical protein